MKLRWSNRMAGPLAVAGLLLLAAASSPVAARPAATVPANFLGEWQRASTQCGGEQEDTLNISRTKLRFYEAIFTARNTQKTNPRVVLLHGIWSEDGEDDPAAIRL